MGLPGDGHDLATEQQQQQQPWVYKAHLKFSNKTKKKKQIIQLSNESNSSKIFHQRRYI